MPDYEEDFRAAAHLEAEGDAAAAAGRNAGESYRAAQTRLIPCGRKWNDPEEYERHMAAFERLQEKLAALDDGVMPGEEWLVPAQEGRLEEAARLLAPRLSEAVGAGRYLSRAERTEQQADEAAAAGDPWGARISYVEALENYLLYALISGVGYEPARRVAAKLV